MSLLRKTTQNPLPVCKPETGKNQYDIYPTHDLGPDKIFCDYTSLARRLAGQKQVVVDGYVGVRFDLFRQELNRALTQLGIRPVWWSVDAALRPQEEIERLVAPIWAATTRSSASAPRCGWRSSSTGKTAGDRTRPRGGDEHTRRHRRRAGRLAGRVGLYRHPEERDPVPLACGQHRQPGATQPEPPKRCTSDSISSTGSY